MDQDYRNFPTTPYRPEGGFNPVGAVLLLVASLLSGLMLGILAGLVARWLYIVLIFPVLIGGIVGAVGYGVIRLAKVRNTALGAVSGLLGGFFAMLSMHYLAYMNFEAQLSNIPAQVREAERKLASMPPEEIQKQPFLDDQAKQAFSDPVHRAGFRVHNLWTFMHYRAKLGVTLSRTSSVGRNDSGMNLGYIGSWIYWSIEVLIVAGIALAVQHHGAKQPFCRRCQNWKEARNLGVLPESDAAALQEGNLLHFATPPPQQVQGLVSVTVEVCPFCQADSPVDVVVSRMTQTGDGVVHQQMAHVTYPGEALPYLEKIFLPVPPPAADPATSGPANEVPQTNITEERNQAAPPSPQ